MNAAYIHITLNTIPPVLNIAGVVILLIGMMRANASVTRTGLFVLLFSALAGVPTFLSGEGAEEIVENMEGVNKRAIHPHEEAGEFTLIVMIVQAVAVVAALIAPRRWLAVAALLIALVSTATVLRTAYLGGKIHHPETGVVSR